MSQSPQSYNIQGQNTQAEPREDLNATADNLANLCNDLREQMRYMQTALDLQDTELRQLRAARAGLMQQFEVANNARLERKIGWVAAMAAELFGKVKR